MGDQRSHVISSKTPSLIRTFLLPKRGREWDGTGFEGRVEIGSEAAE